MRYLKLVFFGAYLSCLALQCDPDNEQKPTYYMSEEFKDYVLFPEGSWWVYENQEGEIDSIKLFHQNIEIKDGKDDYSYDFEWLTQHFKTTYYNDTMFAWGGCRDKGSGYPQTYFEGFGYINIKAQFFSGRDTGHILKINNSLKFTSKMNSLNVLGKDHENIKVFQNLSQNYPLQPEHIYYSKNIGIVKKELFNGTVWKLKNYHINH